MQNARLTPEGVKRTHEWLIRTGTEPAQPERRARSAPFRASSRTVAAVATDSAASRKAHARRRR